MGSDLSVVNAARVSFSKESAWENPGGIHAFDSTKNTLSDKDQKLINYLAKHNHWSPFAHTSLTFRIKAPIFVARQLVKHQVGGVWNEVSRRYVSEEPEFWFPENAAWRLKAENVKQGSSDELLDEDTVVYVDSDAKRLAEITLEHYNFMLKVGVAPEQARMVLPQNTMTEWWWTGSLMFFARVCKQRLDAHAQAETQEIAQLINNGIPQQFQHSWKALMV